MTGLASLPLGPTTVDLRRATAVDLPALVALLADVALGSGREAPDDLAPYSRAFALIDADRASCWWSRSTAPTSSAHSSCPSCRVWPAGARCGRRSRRYGCGPTTGTGAWARRCSSGRSATLAARAGRWSELTTDKTRVDAHRLYERLRFGASHEGYKLGLSEGS